MSEKITPAVKKVDRQDGLKAGSANKTITTPNQPADNKYWGEGTGSKDKVFTK